MLAVLDEFGARSLSRGGAVVAVLWWIGALVAVAGPGPGTPHGAREAAAVFAGAEERFQPPSDKWFDDAQQAMMAEFERVDRALAAHPTADAAFWKSHLRWELLEKNLGPRSTVNLGELELVRRWMYSNRKGIESPFFAPLRTNMDAYLDAAFTASQPDLRAAFNDKVALARRQCLAVAEDPSDANGAALGQTLGWFERTGQLATEVAAVRSLTSLPNAQIVVDGELIARIVATQASAINEKVAISEQVEIPPEYLWQRTRTMRVRGTGVTKGTVQIAPTPNDRVAELALVYQGTVDSTARGKTGSVTLSLTTTGSVEAVKPVYFSPLGLELGKTTVTPHVTSRVTGVSADSSVAERVARSRAGHEGSRSLMNSQARSTTSDQLTAKLDERVEEATTKIRGDFTRMRTSLSEFSELTAPLTREGVTLYFDGARSTASEIQLNAYSRRREQHGAATPCPIETVAGDVRLRVHVSFFNNMAETITGGKTLSDEFIMKYAKVVHAELPLPLMVHSRAPRWSLTMAKLRPIELRIPEANRFVFVVRVDAVEIDGVKSVAPSTAEFAYRLLQDEYGDYQLVRDGVELESALPGPAASFLGEKLGAFFGPVLKSGGVVAPEGGALGALHGLRSRGVHAEHDWIVAGWDVPSNVVEDFIKSQRGDDESLPLAGRDSLIGVREPSNSRR